MNNSMSLIPLWVYPIFIALVFQGIKLCSPCTVKVNRLIILPLIFFLVSTHHFMKASNVSVLNIMSLISGMCFGSYLGYLYKRNYPIRIDRMKGLIYLPTDKTLLTLIMLTFGVELFMCLTEDVRPLPYWWFNPMAMVISGVITGIVIGGNATHFYRYLHQKADSLIN